MKDKDGKDIRWQYLVELGKLQESEGLRLANKLRSAHINWKPPENESKPSSAGAELECC